MENLLNRLLELIIAVWNVVESLFHLILPWTPLVAWVAFWLLAVNWVKFRAVLLKGGWTGLAFIGLIAVINLMLGGVGGWFGKDDFSLQMILGWLFAPVAWLIGVGSSEIQQAGSMIGQKLVLNEFVAFIQFDTIRENLTPRTQGIVTFALCGFANLSSIAILLGGLGVMAPNRRQEIARLGLRAVFAATLANLMSAALAGIFLTC